jgi:hypothetical protein
LCRPRRVTDATHFWGFHFDAPSKVIPLAQFEDLVDPVEQPVSLAEPKADKAADVSASRSVERDEAAQIGAKEVRKEAPPARSIEGAPPGSEGNREALESTKTTTESVGATPVEKRPQNKGGYSVLGPFTPRMLAEYLDVKPFKVIKALMEQGHFASLNDVLELDVVEATCAARKMPPPWLHESLGKRISQNEKDQLDIIQTSAALLARGSAVSAYLSATDVYNLLKTAGIKKPERILSRLEADEFG